MCKSATVGRWDAGHFLVPETPHAVADEICAHLRQNPL